MAAQIAASLPTTTIPGTAASADNLWAAAVAQLSEDDQRQIQTQQKDKLVILNETLSTAQQKAAQCVEKEWKHTRADGTKVVYRDIFNKIVSWIDKFKQVGDLAASFDPTHAAPAWAAVKILLQFAIADSQVYTAMLEGLETVTNLIAQYAVFEEVYLKNSSQAETLLRRSITKLYAQILTYLVKTKKYFGQNTAARIAKGAVTGRQAGFANDDLAKIRIQQTITEELARLIDAEDIRTVTRTTETMSLDMAKISTQLRALLTDMQQPLIAIRNDLTNISRSYDREQKLKILRWVSAMPYPQHHDLVAKHRLKNSGLWFVNHPSYLDWRQSSASCMLWLHGIPGSGKSHLMSVVIDSLRGNERSKTAGSMAYAYCLRSPAEAYRAEPEAIVRSLVRQLTYSASTTAINNVVMQKYETLAEDGFEPRDLNLEECEELILGFLRQRPATIVIDALDECVPERRYQLLGLLERLISSAVCTVKVIVSSRDHGDVAVRMTKLKALTIDTKENLGDIDLYIQAEVDRSIEQESLLKGDVSEKLRTIIVERLKQGAQGMFLWVSLMMRNLCNPERIKFESDALEELEKLPQGLNDLYAKICQRIRTSGSRARRLAETSLKWLICSQSSLKSSEFVAIVSFDAENPEGTASISSVLDVCGNLVIHDTDLDVFRLTHLSIREFLETQSDFASKTAHATAAQVCLSVLTSSEWLESTTAWSSSALYRYATLFSTSHLSMCRIQQRTTGLASHVKQFFATDGILTPYSTKWMVQIVDAARTLSWNDPLREIVKQIVGKEAHKPKTWIFTACIFGLDELVQQVCQSFPAAARDLNAQGATTLHLASQYGHLEIVKMLVGININIDAKNENCESALTSASAHGHTQIVQYLLECNAQQEHDGHKYGSPLQAASFHGHKEVVKMLSVNADLNTSQGQFGTALHAASLRGHRDVVLMLLDLGMDINAPSQTVAANSETVDEDQYYQYSRLEYLSKQLARFGVPKNRFVTKMLRQEIEVDQLQNGEVNIGTHRSGLGSAIQVACRGGHAEVVALLLNHGADIGYEGGMYGHALQAAAVNGSYAIVNILLNAGAYVDAQSGLYGSALQAACRRNNTSTVKLLLDSDAEVNMRGGYYHTPLQAAARTGNSKLISILLQHNANVNIFGGQYHTALQAAAIYGFTDIAQQLVNHGADVNICGGQYHSALEAAAYCGSIDIVKLLFERGANVYNALHIAALEGRLEVVEYLLRQGVDVNVSKNVFGTPLLSAISANRYDIIELLMDYQADVNVGNRFYGYPLQLAAAAGNTSLVQRLLKMASDPTQPGGLHGVYLNQIEPGKRDKSKQTSDDRQESALESAASNGRGDAVRILLKDMLTVVHTGHPWPSIQKNISNIVWSTISMSLLKAARHNQSEIISILLNACENETALRREPALWWACKDGDQRLVQDLLETYGDLMYAEPPQRYLDIDDEFTMMTLLADDLLSVAILNGHQHLLKLLLSSDIEKSIFGKDHCALEAACVAGEQSVVRLFIDEGIDINRGGREAIRPLMLASASGNVAIVEMLLNAGANPHHWSSPHRMFEIEYLTALHAACAEGHEKIVTSLLSHGVTVDVQTEDHPTALFLACEAGHFDIVKMLIQRGANANATRTSSINSDTALQAATSKGFCKIVGLLLENNADCNCHGGEFGTAIKIAAHLGHTNILLALIHAGADINFMEDDSRSKTSELPSIQGDFEQQTGAEVMVEFQSGIDVASHSEKPPASLDEASEGSLDSNYESALEDLLDDLEASHDLDKHTRNYRKESVSDLSLIQERRKKQSRGYRIRLSSALVKTVLYTNQYGAISVVQNMTKATMDIVIVSRESDQRSNGYPQSSRSGSASSGRMSVGEWLDVSIPGRFGSAIHAAADAGWVDCVKILLDHGAEASRQDHSGQTPLHLAANKGHLEIIKQLLNHGSLIDIRDQSGMTALASAAASGHVDILELLISKGATTGASPETGQTPMQTALASAAASGHVDILELLISKGATTGASPETGQTPMHFAAEKNHLNIVKALLNHGADAGALDQRFRTPLYYAIWRDNVQVVRYLMQMGGNAQRLFTRVTSYRTIVKDSTGELSEEMSETKKDIPLLHVAAKFNSHRTLQMLLKQGHDVNAPFSATEDSERGSTPLHEALEACDDSSVDTVSVLLCHGVDPNLKDSQGQSPTSLAIKEKSCLVVDLLLRAGGNLEGCGNGSSMIIQALQSTLRSESCKMMKLVLDHGADVDSPDNQGRTALQILIEGYRRKDIEPEHWRSHAEQACWLLLRYGARIPPGVVASHLERLQRGIQNGDYDDEFSRITGFELNGPLYTLYQQKDDDDGIDRRIVEFS